MVKRVAISMACAAAVLAGCGKDEPKGQVVATVDGQEVTLQEINAEIQAANLPANVDKKAAQRDLLQRIIDRKLIVAAAEEQKIDKTAEYQSAKRRSEELLLAQAYARQQLNAVPLPSDADIKKFMADRANVFTNREQLVLDQIRFAPPKNLASLKVLENDHTMEAVAAHLTQLGIKFERGQAGLDSGQAPPQLIQTINKNPSEPFVVPDRGVLTVSVVVNRRPIPVDQTQAKAGAVSGWRQQKFNDLLQQQVTDRRNKAKITYQDGFAPAPAPAGGRPTGAAPAAPAR